MWFSKQSTTKRPDSDFHVVEVEAPRKPEELNGESRRAMATLLAHPGFLYLCAKLKQHRSFLQSELLTKRQANMTDVEFLQSGVYWCRWLEDTIRREVQQLSKPTPSPATPDEIAAFREAQRAYEMVGDELTATSGS